MAGLYVPGVKKPYGCDFCPWYRTLWSVCTAANKNISVLDMNKGPEWCPLVEVPDHEDLIDRDEAIKEICRDAFPNFSLAVQRIKCIPAIIPADKEEV